MTITDCYERLHGNYNEAKQRLMNDRLIEKFVLKFINDDSFLTLSRAVERRDHDEAFRGAHTLKGVAANLAFTELQQAASDLCEQLRSSSDQADPLLFNKVECSYRLVVDTISAYEKEKNSL